MTEGNSCYRGGKPGMSDAFAASLWAADYLLLLASLGCAGVNLHGGDSRFLSAGLGDHNPGLEVAEGKKPSAPNGFYTPIASERDQPAAARPVFYGMLLAQQFAGATMLAHDLEAPAAVTAYVAQKGARILAAIINKATAPLSLALRADQPATRATLWRLTGPSLDATSGITFGSAAVSDSGAWTPVSKQVPVHTGTIHLELPQPAAPWYSFIDFRSSRPLHLSITS